ncbi:PIG-X [Melampsora americana]|nr:PIG-X [Melampsora americana]
MKDENENKEFELIYEILPNPGLHPRLNLTILFNSNPIQSTHHPTSSTCLISILFKSITSSLFFDKFQLDNLSIESKLENLIEPINNKIIEKEEEEEVLTNQTKIELPISWGSRDLEAPVLLASSSGLLIPLPILTQSIQTFSKVKVEVQVPLHLRYLHPLHSWDSNSLQINLSSPSLIWSCNRSKPLDYQPIIDHSNLIQISAPTGHQNDLIFVEFFTTFLIWFTFLWIGFTSFKSHYHHHLKSS